jgi:hypothetical protein
MAVYPAPSRDLYGLALVDLIRTATGRPCGWITAPPDATGDSPAYPYYVVTPHPATLDRGRTFVNPASGGEFHFDVEAVGTVDRQVAEALDQVVIAVTGRDDARALLHPWTGPEPAPVGRVVVGYGPGGKDDERNPPIRWSSAEIILTVLA